MNVTWIATYILIWPVLSLGVLALLCVALVKDIREARRDGVGLV